MARNSSAADDFALPGIWYGMGFIATLIFIWWVGYGWSKLLATYTPNTATAVAAGWLIAIFAYLLALVMGAGSAARARARSNGLLPRGSSWFALYPFLFVLSALGLLNSAVYLLEGGVVMQEEIDQAQERLSMIDAAAARGLRDPAHARKEARVNQLLAGLEREIKSPYGDNRCGVGPGARRIIGQIRDELPDFHEYYGSSVHDCAQVDRLEAIYRSYEGQAREMLRTDTAFVQGGGSGLRDLQAEMHTAFVDAQSGLAAAEERLAPGNREGRTAAYADSLHALRAAATVYGQYRGIPDPRVQRALTGLPMEIDVSMAGGLGSIGAIVPTLIHRLGYLSTWIYLLVALLIDIGLVLLLARILGIVARNKRRRDGGDELGSGAGAEPTRRANDPAFLWVNQYS